jgi:ADP-ribose pyrophosphatase YjhB (NUDIX family)
MKSDLSHFLEQVEHLPLPNDCWTLFNSAGELSLVHKKDNYKSTVPGGTLDFGEPLAHCAIRELLEQTRFQIRITGLIGACTDPHT